MENRAKRYLLVDGFRGLAIISMVIFHFLYDVNEVFGIFLWKSLTIVHNFILDINHCRNVFFHILSDFHNLSSTNFSFMLLLIIEY